MARVSGADRQAGPAPLHQGARPRSRDDTKRTELSLLPSVPSTSGPSHTEFDYCSYNATWPSEFLVDESGTVRHVRLSEGDYGETEALIRQLLVDRNPQAVLPPPTDVPDATPKEGDTPETYLGAQHEPLHISGPQPQPGAPTAYRFPNELRPNILGCPGRRPRAGSH